MTTASKKTSLLPTKITMMKNVTVLTVFLFLGEIFMSFEGVSGRAHHQSPPRKRRQVTGGNYIISANSNNHYYDPYFLSSSPYRKQQHQHVGEDNNELIASSSNSNIRTIKLSNQNNNNNLLAEEISTVKKEKDYYDPFFYYVPDVVSPGTRNRRNSHGHHMSSSSSSRSDPRDHREVAYLYDRNSKADNNIFSNQSPPHRFQYQSQHQLLQQPRNPNVFLTKHQITSQSRYNPALARYYFPSSNSIDNNDRRNYYDHGRAASNYYRVGSSAGVDNGRLNGGDDDGGAWSIQVGTQLKVNDDGRERNPEQFYVRDETRGGGGGSNRRYTSYYRK